jgi:uncharacterized protein (TIGR02246 family)
MTVDDEIRGGVSKFITTWYRHDPAAFAGAFTEDTTFTNRQGIGARGRTASERFQDPLLTGRLRETHLVADQIRIRVLREASREWSCAGG